MKGSRKLILSGQKFEYRVGKGTTVIRREDNTVLAKVANHVLIGVDPDTYERGQHKRTSDGTVLPLHIQQFIEGGGRAPRFTHDCSNCRFIGSDDEHDFYYCLRAELDMGGSVLARYGDEGPEYTSAPVSIARRTREQGWTDLSGKHVPGSHPSVQNYPTVKALKRAEAMALIPLPKGEPLPEYGDHMPLTDFIERCEGGDFIDYDGFANYASETEMFPQEVYPSDVVNKTIDRQYSHVVWFNR